MTTSCKYCEDYRRSCGTMRTRKPATKLKQMCLDLCQCEDNKWGNKR